MNDGVNTVEVERRRRVKPERSVRPLSLGSYVGRINQKSGEHVQPVEDPHHDRLAIEGAGRARRFVEAPAVDGVPIELLYHQVARRPEEWLTAPPSAVEHGDSAVERFATQPHNAAGRLDEAT